MSFESRVLRHLLGPIAQPAKVRWILPQRLLPPHAADDEPREEPAYMRGVPLPWQLQGGNDGNREARQSDDPEEDHHEEGLAVDRPRQKCEKIDEWIDAHGSSFDPNSGGAGINALQPTARHEWVTLDRS
jgi:hypothetical protein